MTDFEKIKSIWDDPEAAYQKRKNPNMTRLQYACGLLKRKNGEAGKRDLFNKIYQVGGDSAEVEALIARIELFDQNLSEDKEITNLNHIFEGKTRDIEDMRVDLFSQFVPIESFIEYGSLLPIQYLEREGRRRVMVSLIPKEFKCVCLNEEQIVDLYNTLKEQLGGIEFEVVQEMIRNRSIYAPFIIMPRETKVKLARYRSKFVFTELQKIQTVWGRATAYDAKDKFRKICVVTLDQINK